MDQFADAVEQKDPFSEMKLAAKPTKMAANSSLDGRKSDREPVSRVATRPVLEDPVEASKETPEKTDQLEAKWQRHQRVPFIRKSAFQSSTAYESVPLVPLPRPTPVTLPEDTRTNHNATAARPFPRPYIPNPPTSPIDQLAASQERKPASGSDLIERLKEIAGAGKKQTPSEKDFGINEDPHFQKPKPGTVAKKPPKKGPKKPAKHAASPAHSKALLKLSGTIHTPGKTMEGGLDSAEMRSSGSGYPRQSTTTKADRLLQARLSKDSRKSNPKNNKQVKKVKTPSPPPIRVMAARDALVIPVEPFQCRVLQAVSLVSEELQSGAWPCPHTEDAFSPNVAKDAESRYAKHMLNIAVCLEEFARKIVLPSMMASLPLDMDAELPNRAFYGTLLALREVMTQNAIRIFGADSILSGDGSASRDTKPGWKRRKFLSEQEERVYGAQLLATGVVLAALDRWNPKPTSEAEFVRILEAYDNGEPEFSSCFEPADGRSDGMVPNGMRFDPAENIAWKVSFNRARKEHPLVVKSQVRLHQTRLDDGLTHSMVKKITVPKSNACHVVVTDI